HLPAVAFDQPVEGAEVSRERRPNQLPVGVVERSAHRPPHGHLPHSVHAVPPARPVLYYGPFGRPFLAWESTRARPVEISTYPAQPLSAGSARGPVHPRDRPDPVWANAP